MVNKRLSLIISLGALTFATSQSPGQAKQPTADAISAILPLNLQKPLIVPLIEESMRDPNIFKMKIKDDSRVESLAAENKALKAKLKTAKGTAQGKIANQMMENQAGIAYYYADRLSGRFGGGPVKKYQSLMTSGYRNLIEYATVVQSVSNNPSDKATATYHAAAASYILGDQIAKNLGVLGQLTGKDAKLPERLVKRAKFLQAVADLGEGKAQAAGVLESLANELTVSGGAASKLALARFQAGLSGRGEKVGQANDSYKKLLFAASDKAFTVGARNQLKLFEFVLGVWRFSEGPQAPWKNPPLNEERFKDFPEMAALTERNALWEWNFGKKQAAIDIYNKLVDTLKAESIATKLDRRVIDLEELLFRQTLDYASFEKSLLDGRKRYDDSKALGRDIGKDEKSFAGYLAKKHRSLVDSSLLAASSPSFTDKGRLDAISLASRFISSSDLKEPAEREPIEAKVAGLWVLNKNYGKAVEAYLRIAKTTVPQRKVTYLEEAVKSQSILAAWPKDPPWTPIEAKNSNERKKLLEIFVDLNELQKSKVDWVTIAHIGQLHLNLNESQAAFKVWDDAIRKAPQNPAANLAAGIMLSTYLKTQNWDGLESTSRFALSAKMKPVFNNAQLVPGDLLPLALLKGGDAAMKAEKFNVASRKYKELSSKFHIKEDDYVLQMLASAYRGDGKHKDSIETLIEFIDRFPKSPYIRDVLANGGKWSVPIAYEENAMYFLKEFLKRFPGDPEAGAATDDLAKLYMGRRLYAEALALYRELSAAPQALPQSRLKSLAELMRIEFKFGSKERAYQAADQLIKAGAGTDLQAEAYTTRAQSYYTRRNVAGLQQTESQLRGLGSSSPVQDALGRVRFLLAEAKLGPIFESVNSPTVKNPIQAVFDRYNLFTKSQADYQNVCSSGSSSMCGPALHRLARFAERLIQLMEEFQIPATLDEKEINDFIRRKNELVAGLRKLADDSDRRAAGILESGHTDPEWTNQILWQNYSDSNFSSVSGSSGSGYIQWALKAAP